MDALFDSLKDFDIATVLPELEGFLGSLRFWCGFAALLGPVLLLAFGLINLLKPDAEITRFLGFRVFREDASESVRKYAQRLTGLCWTGAGGALAIVTLLVLLFSIGTDALGMLTATAVCLLVQLAAVIAIWIIIRTMVKKHH